MVPTASLLLQAPSSIVPCTTPLSSSSSSSNRYSIMVVLSSASPSFFTSSSSLAVTSCPCSSPGTSVAASSFILATCICATPGLSSKERAIGRQSTSLKQLGMRRRPFRGNQSCRCPFRTLAFFDLNGNQGEEGRPNCITEVLHKCAILFTATAVAVSLWPAALPADAFAKGPILSDLAVLISGPPIKDPNTLLRNALPIDNKPIKEVQKSLEDISENLRVPGVKALDPVERNIRQAARILNQNKIAILASIADSQKEYGNELLDKLNVGLQEFQRIVEEKNREAVAPKQKELLSITGNVEEAMVDKFPFEIPDEYASKPLLKGRATVEMKVKVKDNPNLNDVVFQLVLDGYSAPVTAGNFVDLVERHFYDGMEIQRADGFVVQTGDPNGPAEGFVDPSTEKIRTIPLEIMIDGDSAPVYGATLEELGRYKARTRLPFNAFGTLAMARDEFENDSASSQIFWLLKESELTPSNANILDGRYTVFGYVTDNQDYLADLKVGDVIESMKVVSGLDNLVNPSYKIVG